MRIGDLPFGHSLIQKFGRSVTDSVICSFTGSFIDRFTHSLIDSLRLRAFLIALSLSLSLSFPPGSHCRPNQSCSAVGAAAEAAVTLRARYPRRLPSKQSAWMLAMAIMMMVMIATLMSWTGLAPHLYRGRLAKTTTRAARRSTRSWYVRVKELN